MSSHDPTRNDLGDPTKPERPDLSLGDVVGKLGDDLSGLLTTQVEIAKLEIKQEVTKAAKGAGLFGSGAFAAVVAVFMLSAALAWGIAEFLDPWAGFLIVGLIWTAVAVALGLSGKKKFDDVNAVPEATAAELRADRGSLASCPDQPTDITTTHLEDPKKENHMTNDIESLRNEADQRREAIARDVELVTDRVDPSRIADRQKAKINQRWGAARDRVFGSSDRTRNEFPPPSGDRQAQSDGGTSITDRASGALDSAKEKTPDSVGEFTEGNPLAAGIIGLGVGLLAASLIPSTREEQRMADKVQDRIDDAATEIARSGQQAAENVQPQAVDAVAKVKESAQDSAKNVQGDAKSAATDVADEAKSQAKSQTD